VIFLLFGAGVLLVGLSGRLLAHAIAVPRLQLRSHLRELDEYGFQPGVHPKDHRGRARLNEALAQRVGRIGRLAITTVPALTPLERGRLTAAGFYDLLPEVAHGYRVLTALFLPSLIILYEVAAGGGFSMLTLLVVGVAATAGWVLPATVIRQRGNARLADMDKRLPELIDLLTATVEAGMGFEGSIKLVTDRFEGGLGDELRLTLKQQSLGISSTRALEDMVERCDTPSIRAFVRTVIRAESLGSSIGPVLRELAGDLRRRRRQTAREKMQKAPVKMIFPLMFLIFPALMIVILYPAAYSVLQNFSSF
jgi:tight adherence protein C